MSSPSACRQSHPGAPRLRGESECVSVWGLSEVREVGSSFERALEVISKVCVGAGVGIRLDTAFWSKKQGLSQPVWRIHYPTLSHQSSSNTTRAHHNASTHTHIPESVASYMSS